MIAFTLGDRDIYENAEHTPTWKLKGGSVWRTIEDALRYKGDHDLGDFGVYAVQVDGEDDISYSEEDGFGTLLRDARLIPGWKGGV